MRIRGIAVVDGYPVFRFAADGVTVEIQGEVRDFRIAEDAGKIPPIQPIPHNNDVVLHPNLLPFGLQDVGGGATRQPMTKPLPRFCAAGQVRRPLHEKGRHDHREHRDRKKDLIWITPQETAFLPLLRQQETKLSDLGQRDAHHNRRTWWDVRQ
jgi:hypothetical protein